MKPFSEGEQGSLGIKHFSGRILFTQHVSVRLTNDFVVEWEGLPTWKTQGILHSEVVNTMFFCPQISSMAQNEGSGRIIPNSKCLVVTMVSV